VRLPDLVALGQAAVAGGVTQLWVTDNLGNRNVFAVLAALAAKIPVSLGTAVAVPYFHNPVDIAGAAAAINEMMDGRELSLGIARGNQSTASFIETPKPVTILRETAQSLSRLLSGEKVTFDAYPNLASYFNLNHSAPFRLSFTPPGSVRLYCGGNGPLSLAVGGQFMDGLIFGGTFQAVGITGRLPSLLRTFDDAAEKAGKGGEQRKVAEIKLSVSRDAKAARRFVASSAGTRILSLRHRGFSEEEIARTGVAPDDLDRLEKASMAGAPREQLSALVTDAMIDAIFVAGDPGYCRERMVEVCKLAEDNGFDQLMFSELGPDPAEGLQLMCDEILPAL
jgi:alkanesulfonate monooxygenase SsuD/methylene tetrahydromethanopterin reductase-like flavin-dependent oxidoreductase (luciferase family)